jgi:DNA-binding NarL/FixJ family response regulator
MTMRVLIVDDHPVFRDGLAALLRSKPDFEVVGLVADGREAVDFVRATPTDIVLMDLNLPTMSGVEATAAINALQDRPGILVLTMVDDDDTVIAAMRAGARGYVLKGADGDEIASALRTVASGGAVFGAGVALHVLALSSTPRAEQGSDPSGLTDREREVLEMLANGSSNAQIARSLGLSLKTIQNYVSRILDKLQVSDRTQAALRAQRERDLGV